MATSNSPTPDTDVDAVLATSARHAGGLRAGTAALLADAVLAVAFAAGLAGAVASVAAGEGPWVAWLGLAALAACLRGAGALLGATAAAGAAGRAKLRLRDDLVRGVLAQPLRSPTADRTAGALMQAIVDDVEAFDAYLSRFVPARRAAAVAPLGLLAAVAAASLVTAGILAATLLPFVLLMMFAGAASAAESRRQFKALARLSSLFADRLRALPVVLSFGAGPRETARLADAAHAVARATMKVLRLAFVSSAVLEFFAALGVALVAVYAGFSLLGLLPFAAPEPLDLGRAFFVLVLAPEFYLPMRRLAAAYHDAQAAKTAAAQLLAFRAPPGSRADEALPRPAAARRAAPRLCFDGVSIRHEGDDRTVVQNLSFDLEAGRTLALVGPSGSGKTSVLRALLGLAPVTAGRILLDGGPIGDGPGVAALAAWIGQTPLIVAGTLRDNLLLGAPDRSEVALSQAISLAGLGPLLGRRAGGLDAAIDARGSGLSGGERRRIALVRALLKPSCVWLLDEPTSHLDDAAERDLVDCIARARAGRTTVIATHSERLTALADVVIRLDDPR